MSANAARIEAIRKEFSLFRLQDLTLTLADFERTCLTTSSTHQPAM